MDLPVRAPSSAGGTHACRCLPASRCSADAHPICHSGLHTRGGSHHAGGWYILPFGIQGAPLVRGSGVMAASPASRRLADVGGDYRGCDQSFGQGILGGTSRLGFLLPADGYDCMYERLASSSQLTRASPCPARVIIIRLQAVTPAIPGSPTQWLGATASHAKPCPPHTPPPAPACRSSLSSGSRCSDCHPRSTDPSVRSRMWLYSFPCIFSAPTLTPPSCPRLQVLAYAMGRGPLQQAHLPSFPKFAAAMTLPVIPRDGECMDYVSAG